MCDKDKKRPNINAFFTNLKVEMPLTKKIYLLLRNNKIKIIKRRNCCGNYGEPGC